MTITADEKTIDSKPQKLIIETKEDAINWLKTQPKELTNEELENALDLSKTYSSKYKNKKEREKSRYDRVRPVLELFEIPDKRGKWLNTYSKQSNN